MFQKLSPSVPKFLLLSFISFCIALPAFSPAKPQKTRLKEYSFGRNQTFKVGFDGRNIVVYIRPKPGEGAFRFAAWTMRDWRNNYKKIEKYNNNKILQKGHFVRFPFKVLNDAMQSLVLQTLFSNDSSEESVWAHRVMFKGETISLIAGVFAKKEISARQIIRYNKLKRNGKHLGIGDTVNIPWKWIRPELNLKPIEVKKPLVVKIDQFGKRYAYYSIKKGESFYSSVIIRFTGRTLAEDVNDMADHLLKLNAIKDERFIPVGLAVKIPLEWISEEYLVKQRPTPSQPEKAEPEKMAVVKDVPVHVIIDPGHGGKDPGAVYGTIKEKNRIYEDETVYDIALRLAGILKRRNYHVYMTLTDPNQPKPVKKLAIVKDSDERILVHPNYNIQNVNIGVNMRILLVNDIYLKLRRKKVPANNIVLISLHGDALHRSLQGVTVYYPDARLRRESFSKKHRVYRKRQEYRSKYTFPIKANSRSAILSARFGKTIIKTFASAGLKTHSSFAVRGYYYRKGQRTLPGILRYSKVPTSVLVEVGNINNVKDRNGFRSNVFRQRLATALADSIKNRFNRG
jgi:N-acetylmuramoyl-L-alanine amidase